MSRPPIWRTSLRRTSGRFEPRPKILIVCEGQVTEPRYFMAWRHETRNNMVTIEIVGAGADPKAVVQMAVNRKGEADRAARKTQNSFERYDEIWCVFDRDEHPRFEEAKVQAHANGISVAISNPCFELWLLLHFGDQRAHIERAALVRALKPHCPGYEKDPPFTRLREFYDEALRRATELHDWQRGRDCEGENPDTAVHILIEKLRSQDKDKLLKLYHSK